MDKITAVTFSFGYIGKQKLLRQIMTRIVSKTE